MPHELPLLNDLLVILLVSVLTAFICSRLRLPTIVGFMLTGVLIGPYSLGLIKDVYAIEVLAEIGVVLLLFTIGLEFSLRRIFEMKRLVLIGGNLQVLLTVLAVLGIALIYGRPFNQAIFFGFLFALSSTAIVLKSYVDRAEVDAPHGRAGIGILLFQDLSIVPMMLLIPILGGNSGASVLKIVLTLGGSILAIVAIVFTARIVMPVVLHQIVQLRSSEVFIIFVVLVSLGTAWLTSQFGLSLALGSFIAGMVLSESEYSHQIVADILPFRDVFNSIFFISIGMLLSLKALASDYSMVLVWVSALIIGKIFLIVAIVRIMGYSIRVATMTGLGLAQVGEFSFILAKAGMPQGLLSETDYQRFLGASILSMIATPFLIKAAPRISYALQSRLAPSKLFEPSVVGFNVEEPDMNKHVVVVGYGLNGRNLAKVLRKVRVPYLVLELNGDVVRKAREQDERIIYGEATRREVLHHIGIEKARCLVIAISDPTATRHCIWLARQMNPNIHIIVRTRYMTELQDLCELGANEVIPEEFETSIEIFSRVLKEFGISQNIIHQQVTEVRSEQYEMFRSPSLPSAGFDAITAALNTASAETLLLTPDSTAVGKTIGDLKVRAKTGATIVAVIRDGVTEVNPGADFRLEAEDVLVFLGNFEQIDLAIEQIQSFGNDKKKDDEESIAL